MLISDYVHSVISQKGRELVALPADILLYYHLPVNTIYLYLPLVLNVIIEIKGGEVYLMIKLPTKDEIDNLSKVRHEKCVSIYSAYIAPNANTTDNPNRIQLKNLIKEARDMLMAEGVKMRQIDKILGPADKLIESLEFGTRFKYSLALFLYDGFFKFYRLPTIMNKSLIFIGDRFRVNIVQKLVKDNAKYYLLSLSHNGAKLMVGDRYELNEVKMKKPIEKISKELNIDENPKSLQPHPIGPNSRGKKSERFHEQYDQPSYDKQMLLEYFKHIDDQVRQIIKDDSPLILAGTGYLLPIYRRVSKYPRICHEEIRGNIAHQDISEIKKQVCRIIEI